MTDFFKKEWRTLSAFTIFCIAMAFLEAAVVVYLRNIYYAGQFEVFPLKHIPASILFVEIGREIATIVMLITVAYIVGKNKNERFALFLYAFAIWDIFYYFWLYATIGWPASLFTWDVLFLIPFAWVGPVIAPVLCSVTMILIAYAIYDLEYRKIKITVKLNEWALLLGGALLIFISFIQDHASMIIKNGLLPKVLTLGSDPKFQALSSTYVPLSFNWLLFMVGEFLILAALFFFYKRLTKK